MNKSPLKGFVLGLLGPIFFIAAVVLWVRRFTGKVPFPVSKPSDGQLTWRLVPPEQVSSLVDRWKKDMQVPLSKLQQGVADIRAQILGDTN